jgi:hypothetical protein
MTGMGADGAHVAKWVLANFRWRYQAKSIVTYAALMSLLSANMDSILKW